MTLDELLAQLKDISEPSSPGWWPLAQGWWYLIGCCLLILVSAFYFHKRKAVNRAFVSADSELKRLKDRYLEDNDATKLAFALSAWLKRVALYTFPEKNPAGLTGRAWLEFLDATAGITDFTSGAGQVFSSEIYSNRPREDGARLIELCERWLTAVKPQMISQDRY